MVLASLKNHSFVSTEEDASKMAVSTSALAYVLLRWNLYSLPPTTLACVKMNTGSVAAPGPGPPGPPCLHVDTPVTMGDGRTWTKAGDLSIGDRVSDGEGGSTSVIWIPVSEKETEFDFIIFHTDHGLGSTVTPGHYVFAGQCGQSSNNNGSSSWWRMKRADQLVVGECVPTDDDGAGEDRIIAIDHAKLKGKVLPITENGKLSTRGVVMSSYCAEYLSSEENGKYTVVDCVRLFYNLGENIYNLSPDEKFADSIVNKIIDNFGLRKLYKFY